MIDCLGADVLYLFVAPIVRKTRHVCAHESDHRRAPQSVQLMCARRPVKPGGE